MGIFIWYVAYVNYGIKEMYCFNRQRVKSGTAWVAGIPTDGSPIILYQILVQYFDNKLATTSSTSNL